jgi:hypothetical protein
MTTQAIPRRGGWFAVGGPSVADLVCLAAAPTFATMALLTGVLDGGPQDMICAALHGASPPHGMACMYALMSACHSAPWLRLIARRRLGADEDRVDE